ncbi:MAG: hypothetical protein ACRDQ5_11510 [Sciscionella sp.]
MSAGDRLYAANVLSHMSRLTVQIGHSAVTEHERLRNARQAVALARAGLNVADGKATPVLSALLHAVEERGHALLGDANATRAAVLEAEQHYERSRAEDETTWLRFYTEAELAADLGRCLRDVGESKPCVRLLTRALETNAPGRVRSRCIMVANLASAHLVDGDLDQAAAMGRDAVRTAAEISSTRALDRLRTLQQQVRPLRTSSTHLVELDERITDLLTRGSTRRDEDSAT